MRLLLFLSIFLATSVSFGQSGGVYNYVKLLPTTLPTSCVPGNLRVKSGTSTLNYCGSANTWTQVLNGTATIAQGGTNTSHALYNNRMVVSSGGTIAEFAPGTSGQILQSNGINVIPSWVTNAPAASNITGIIAVANGGTNTGATLSNNRFMVSSGGSIGEASPVASSSALISDANGLPTASVTTSTQIGYLSTATSNIQTQLNGKEPTITTLPISKGGTNAGTALNNNRVIISSGGTMGEIASGGTIATVLTSQGPSSPPVWATSSGGMSNPMTTTGDIIYSSSGSTPARLGIGSGNDVLTVSPTTGIPSWSSIISNASQVYSTAYFSGATWSTTSGSFATMTPSGTNALTYRKNNGISLAVAGSNDLGFTFTPATSTAAYDVSLKFSLTNASNFAGWGCRLWDGTTTVDDNPSVGGPNAAGSGSQTQEVMLLHGVYQATSTSAVTLSVQCATISGTLTSATGYGTFGNSLVEIKIVQLPIGYIPYNVSARYFNATSAGTLTSSLGVLKFSTKEFDDNSAYNTTNGVFTCPVTSKYYVTAQTQITAATATAAASATLAVLYNGVVHAGQTVWFATAATKPVAPLVHDLINCTSGQTISTAAAISAGTTPSIAASTSYNFIEFRMVGN